MLFILIFISIDENINFNTLNIYNIYNYNNNELKLNFNLSKNLLFDYFILFYFKKIIITDFDINNIFNEIR